MAAYFGKETPKLGFGLMRLPKKDGVIDVEALKEMVDLFLGAGFTYFDTAFAYTGSEEAIREALVRRYPRSAYTLASKINVAERFAPDGEASKSQLFTSLERSGAGYFDYYLLHAIKEQNVSRYEEFGIWDFVREQKEAGLIRHLGFSFHDSPELLDRLLTEHPEVEFVQLQINYADWEDPRVASRKNYEVARRHGKSVVVMEPVKGGKLADPPDEVKKRMRACRPELSAASWAIRFAASLDGILTVLSGMSNREQMLDNLSYMKDFSPLNGEEQAVVRQAQAILGAVPSIPCTACRYCTEGCPAGIRIPEIFAAMNDRFDEKKKESAGARYAEAVREGGRPEDCVGCRQCEDACPQHLPITDLLKGAAARFSEEKKS